MPHSRVPYRLPPEWHDSKRVASTAYRSGDSASGAGHPTTRMPGYLGILCVIDPRGEGDPKIWVVMDSKSWANPSLDRGS